MKTSISILSSCGHKPMTKRLDRARDGSIIKTSSPMCKWFRVERAEFETIFELAKILEALEEEKHQFVIRGEPVPGVDLSKPVRRTKYDDDDHPATFRSSAAGERWVCFDFDKIVFPTVLSDLSPTDAMLALAYLLPEEFHYVTFLGQWSSSAGLDGWATYSAHLWFMLENPATDDDLNEWAKARAPHVDYRLFNAVQPHFTATPIIGEDVQDPCPQRSYLFVGTKDVVMDLSLSPTGRYVSEQLAA